MIVILLLVSRAVAAEWVEISQQHYRKPMRTNFNFPVEKVIELTQPAKPQTIYTNESLHEHVWSKGNINKVPKLGNVQRVQLDNNPVKAPSLRGTPMTIAHAPVDYDNKNNNRETGIVPMKTRQEDYNLDGSFEFNIESSSINSVRNIDRYNDNTRGEILDSEKDKKFKTNKLVEEHRTPTNRHNNRPASSTKIKETVEDISNSKKHSTIPPTTSAIDVLTNVKRPNYQNQNLHAEKKPNKRANQNIIKGVATKTSFNTDDAETTVETENVRDENIAESPAPMKTSKDNEKYNQKVNTDRDNSEPSNDSKTNAVENLIKFVKVVADTIRRNTRRSVTSKTKYLENLKESILGNIEDQINAAWPDDDVIAPPRHRRAAAQATSRGHVQIPSSESALMTISFLTFAVFLIKLVLQVIQTYKNKAMMVAPTVVATVGRAARKHSKSKP